MLHTKRLAADDRGSSSASISSCLNASMYARHSGRYAFAF